MSWHCSRVLAEAFSEATYLAGAPSAQSNTTLTPEAFYWPDKTTEHSRLSRFGMTSEPLTADRGEDLLTWFREVFLAKTSAPQDEATALTVSAVGSGRKWLGLLARYDHDSLSWKTPQCSLVEGLDEFSATWPRWGSMRNGESWERMTAVPHTAENESGFLPTPVATDAGSGRFNTSPGPAGKRPTLALMARKNLWPERLYPTATASMSKASSLKALTRKDGRDRTYDRLDHFVYATEGGRLNPEWVEWLMGWPIGLTGLKPLETAKFQEWQQQHGES